jgi:hypothetical protein
MKHQNKSAAMTKPIAIHLNGISKAAIEANHTSGRWGVVHHARLPHKAGLPLSSGSTGDHIER